MYNYLISIAFLGVIAIPVFILFLTFIQEIGEDLRKRTVKTSREDFYNNNRSTGKENYHEKLRRVK